MFKAGDVVILANGRKIRLVAPVTRDERAYGTFWIAPGNRWITRRKTFSSVTYSHTSDKEPQIVADKETDR